MYQRYIFIFFLCLSSSFGAFGQSFRFDYYGVSDGIPEDFVYTINQDDQGYLIVGTDEGIFRFNGFQFTKIFEGVDKTKFLESYKSSDGTIWFGKNKGGVIKYQNNSFDTLSLGLDKISRISTILEDENHSIWISSLNSGIFKVDTLGKVEVFTQGIEDLNIYSFAKTKNGFLIGTDTGLYTAKLNQQGEIITTEVEDIFYTNITSITSNGEKFLVGTESLGGFQVTPVSSDSLSIKALEMNGKDLSGFHINHLFNDGRNSIWVSTNKKGLLQLCLGADGVCHEVIMYNQGGLKGAHTINESFVDREGNIWLASIDEGVISLRNDYFSFYPLNNISPNREVLAFKKVGNSTFWLATENQVLRCNVSPWSVEKAYGNEEGLPTTEYTSLEIDSLQTVWVGTLDHGLFYKKANADIFSKFHLPIDFENKAIHYLYFHQAKLYVATDFGLLELEGGKVKKTYTMNEGLPHNKISSIFSYGRKLFIATRSNEVTYLQDDSIYIQKIPMTLDYRDSGMRQYTADKKGKIWVCTSGAGISSVEGENSIMLTEEDGLMSNFVHSIICDNNNRLWMTHRGGLSRYDILKNEFKTYNPIEGKKNDFSNNASIKDDSGRLWFASNRGLLRYRPELDILNTKSPLVNFVSIMVNTRPYHDQEEIKLGYDDYEIKIKFEGISLKKPEGVKYTWILEGDDKEWSPRSSINYASYKHIKPGKYTFKVKAYNADGVGGDKVYHIKFSIDKPIWEKWWFYVLLVLGIFSVFYGLIKIREKRYVRNQAYLQKELDARTKEVVVQKEKLEIINIDLTDSIEYAKNIQTAILPSPQTLPQLFSDSMVFYKPRDIVSGDFYWVEKYEDVVAMAVGDCTGHGVPGAFMSLIGSALLKDISSRPAIDSPDKLMKQLDRELKEMLNKKDSKFGVHDGMDITIVAFDMTRKVLQICSGKRPVVLYIGGEQILMKGDRFSVGGYGETEDKKFTVTEYQLHKGDRFYMYSDGIVDQFGGERGKKLKNRAFLEYLDSIQGIPLKEQEQKMKQFFMDWKGNLMQIDDVIVVGIEV